MGIVERVRGAWNLLLGAPGRASYKMLGNIYYNSLVNLSDFITKAYQLNADVYSITSYIANKAAEAPFVLYRVKNEKALRQYKALTSIGTSEAHFQAKLIRTKALEEVGEHELTRLLNESPNPNMTGSELVYAIVIYRLITGNSYLHGIAPESSPGKFREVFILPSQYTTPVSDGLYHEVTGYKLDFMPGEQIEKDRVLHLKYFNPNFQGSNPFVVGQSPLQAAANAVLRSNSAYQASAATFQNGGVKGILYEDGNSIGVTDDQRKDWQEFIDNRTQSGGNFRQILAASSKLGYINVGSTPVDLGILDSLQADLRTLCNVYHINSAIFNDPENKTYNNMREARKAALTDAVMPELTAIKDGMNKWLLPGWMGTDKGYYLDFDYSVYPELQSNLKEISEYLAISPEL